MGVSIVVVIRTIAWLIALAWLGKFVETAAGVRRVINLQYEEYDVWLPGEPRVVVIVPARNEGVNVGACLKSLIAQDYRNLWIVAVDDRSEDATGAAMRELADTHPGRMEMLTVTELPAGWLGKIHAMAAAAAKAIAGGTEYLLFTDADVVFAPHAVRRAVTQAVATGADHFVVLPTTLVKTHGEGMMLGFLQVISLWAIRPWRVADPGAKRDAIGVGAFNMVRTDAYERLGGFAAMPMEILEDLELGRRIKRAGLRQRVAAAPGMVKVHWAPGAWGIVRGMTKNIFAVFGFRVWLAILAAAGVAVSAISPVAMLAFQQTRVAGVCALASVLGLYALSARTSRISWFYAIGFPVAAAAVVYSMARSTLVTLWQGGVRWRGTFYPLDELRRQRGGAR